MKSHVSNITGETVVTEHFIHRAGSNGNKSLLERISFFKWRFYGFYVGLNQSRMMIVVT